MHLIGLLLYSMLGDLFILIWNKLLILLLKMVEIGVYKEIILGNFLLLKFC